MKKRLLVSGFLLVVYGGCGKPPVERHIVPAFYHWQTGLEITLAERLFLDSMGVEKLYVKFFDVDWDDASRQPVPLAPVEIDTTRLGSLEIVPTVFITNRTLLNVKLEEVPVLARRVFDKIASLAQPLQTSHPAILQSFQFDCDWTESTREKFFAFLVHFRAILNAPNPKPKTQIPELTATIRLHQLKFFEKTGVPPVDKGMLMFYNMGDLEDWQTENSILDITTAKKYLTPNKYPLPLDVALPLFHWGVVFREGKLARLINDLSEADLQDTTYFALTAHNRYEIRQSTYMQGQYLYKGDQVRLEGISVKELEQSVALLNNVCNQQEMEIAFYHLDTGTVKVFPANILQQVLEGF
ncbi:MAG: hypothetical protein H6577_00235 [Lewinellaceae bacterium]|nr:hypothetical protein [Saprospiraceae bacterium]MCB9336537.1 hypothetical protein [Lewinellaceae bacterium]